MKCVIIGAGGQAEVTLDILKCDKNIEVVGFIDNLIKHPTKKTVDGLPILGDNSVLPELMKKGIRHTIIAIGENFIRKEFSEYVRKIGMELVRAIHPRSTIAHTALLGRGITVAAGSIICSHVKIKDNSIINTGSLIDHHTEIGENSHIGPGVRIAGRTKIGDNTFIGVGTTVIDNIRIGNNTVIGAGAVVTKSLPYNVVAVGVPAKIIRKRGEREAIFK